MLRLVYEDVRFFLHQRDVLFWGMYFSLEKKYPKSTKKTYHWDIISVNFENYFFPLDFLSSFRWFSSAIVMDGNPGVGTSKSNLNPASRTPKAVFEPKHPI